MHFVMLRTIHYPILTFALIYPLIRYVKAGYMSAAVCAGGFSLYTLHSIYNTSSRFPFEVAYPAHPLVIEKRQEAIYKWWSYDPQIIKHELEYLNRKVYSEGYSKQFQTPKGYKYEIAVDEGETYINCIDDFEKIFEFSRDVLKENQFMDILSPEDYDSHKLIVDSMYSVYKDFTEEYLRKEYKPDTSMYKHAIESYGLAPDIFEKEDAILTKKEKLQKELFLKAYQEVQESKLQNEKTQLTT